MRYEIWSSSSFIGPFYLYDKNDRYFGSIADHWHIHESGYVHLIRTEYEYLQEFDGDEKEFLLLCQKLTGKK